MHRLGSAGETAGNCNGAAAPGHFATPTRGQQALNSVDYNPLLRAALVRMDRWVSGEEDPPPSRYPRLADGTAVVPDQPKGVFTAIPAVGFPAHPPRVISLDFEPGREGVVATLPPKEGKPYPHFVPAVDRDGNEVSSIRLPDLTVPLATYTGWNLRHPQMGAPDRLMSLMGSTIPFPATPEERLGRSDPRRSIAERYPTRNAYLEQLRQEAQRCIDEGYLLAEDLELVVGQASRRYRLLATAREPCRRRRIGGTRTPLILSQTGRSEELEPELLGRNRHVVQSQVWA